MEDAFLAALHDQPSDEVTWLALADWLDEAGQGERAELIRIVRQLRTQPVMEPTPPRRQMEARLAELLRAGVRPMVPELVNSIGMRFALIPPGVFRMGSPHDEKGHFGDEAAHEVEITRPFYLGVFAVTQAEFEQIMGHNPSAFSRHGEERQRVVGLETSRFPVETVSWEDALSFCHHLGNTLGETRAGRVYRLPTEAEWEYACRAGTTTPYHCGDNLEHQANCVHAGKTQNRPCAVGSYSPNAFGLYDMHGNVWEWCADWYDEAYYDKSSRLDPTGPASGEDRALRGGSWDSEVEYSRSAERDYNSPDQRLYINGFRIVLDW